MEEREIIFVLGDKLPLIYDVAISLFSVSTKPTSEKMNKGVVAYVNSLHDVWTRAFGEEHVLRRSEIKKHVETIIHNYNTQVYIEQGRTKPKNKYMTFVRKSLRQLNREWRNKSVSLRGGRGTKPQAVTIDGLFDIGVNMVQLTGNELLFYQDQKGARIFWVSEQVDEAYVIERQWEEAQKREVLEREEREAQYSEENIEILDVSSSNESTGSVNRSGRIRVATEDISVQFDSFPKKRIRMIRDCTNEVKATCVAISVNCNLSTEMSRLAFQTICSKQYGHDYFLSADEAIEKDPSLAAYREENQKDVSFVVEPTSSTPRRPKSSKAKYKARGNSKDDYKVYENVIPSARTLNDFKQVLAIQHEQSAATALNEIAPSVKVTLHYDTTSRSNIDGDWPALILIFSDRQRFPLRPLFFAYEDRVQIIRLIVETYKRLAATLNLFGVTSKSLWEKTTALMTDSVEKNLKIGEGVAEKLQSNIVPLHLLCKSHPVEAFDRSNLAVLSVIENKLAFRQSLQTINPAVRSFLRGKSVVDCAMTSILSLVTHDKSAVTTNQAELFDYIIEREGAVKHIAMYYERRFTKLGYSAASILEALPYLRMLLDETHLNNQHVEIVRMFLDSEFLITELSTLAYFTHKITLPFLYFVEVNSQEDLLKMFPQLYTDLKVGNMDTLKDYIIEYPHVKVHAPTADVSSRILNKMCLEAATVLDRQAGREYGFGELQLPVRATQLHLLTAEERKGLSTNNLDAERHLTVMGRRAPLAKFRNKKFVAKGIRNDCTLYKSETFSSAPSNGLNAVVKVLNNMEAEWFGEQKELLKLKIKEKIEKGRKQSMYTDKILQLCKSWGGPAISVEELMTILQKFSDNKEKIVRNELVYYRDTHKSEILSNPGLFKVNKVSYDEQLLNLCTLLAGKDPMVDYVSLPTNADATKLLTTSAATLTIEKDDEENDIVENRNYVTLISEGNTNTWYIATCIKALGENSFEMDFLHRLDKESNLKWKHPWKPDKAILTDASIVSCTIDGAWDVSRERNVTFTLRNHEYINKIVEDL